MAGKTIQQRKQSAGKKRRPIPKGVYLVLVILCFSFLLATRLYVNQPITGDEPHYLLMDYSLIHDHDLNLKNNYLNGGKGSYYGAPLSASQQVGVRQYKTNASKWYSIHTIGLPITILPAYLLAGKTGVIIEMTVISTLVIVLTYIWVLQVTKSRKLAMISAGILLFCTFFNGLSGYIYPDMLIALLALASLIIIERYYDKPLAQLIFGIIVGFLVLVHFKGLALSIPLLLIIIYKNWHNKKTVPWLAIVGSLPIILYYFLSLHHWFGVWNPSETYTSNNSLSPPIPITSAILFDSARGLFVNNPILILVFVGLPIWYKAHRESFIITLVTVLPLLGLIVTFSGWQGGDSPTGRYVMDVTPLLMPAVALAISKLVTVWQKTIVAILFLATLAISLDAILTKWQYISTQTTSTLFTQIQNVTGLRLERFLPTYNASTGLTGKYGILKLLVCYLILAACIFYGVYLSRSVAHKKAEVI